MVQPYWWNDPITERQQAAIETITQWLGHVFNGSVKGDARDFIAAFYAEAKHVRDKAEVQSVTNIRVKFMLEAKGPWD